MSTVLSRVGFLMLIGSCTLVLADYGRELIAVDRCLDDGGVYDYDAGRCRDDVIHLSHVPYAVRRKALLPVLLNWNLKSVMHICAINQQLMLSLPIQPLFSERSSMRSKALIPPFPKQTMRMLSFLID